MKITMKTLSHLNHRQIKTTRMKVDFLISLFFCFVLLFNPPNHTIQAQMFLNQQYQQKKIVHQSMIQILYRHEIY